MEKTKKKTSHAKKRIGSGSSRSRSSASVRKSRGTHLGRILIAAAEETVAHLRGEIRLESYTLPGPIDVKAIRRKTGLSQAGFAAAFALNRRTLQDWEQHKGEPDGAVRAYLTVIDRNPKAVIDALRP